MRASRTRSRARAVTPASPSTARPLQKRPAPPPRATRARARVVQTTHDEFAAAAAWARTAKSVSVSNCESGGNPRAVSSTGRYRGKWQASPSFWEAYGGLEFAPTADLASEAEQDVVAYRGWCARSWQPWSCA